MLSIPSTPVNFANYPFAQQLVQEHSAVVSSIMLHKQYSAKQVHYANNEAHFLLGCKVTWFSLETRTGFPTDDIQPRQDSPLIIKHQCAISTLLQHYPTPCLSKIVAVKKVSALKDLYISVSYTLSLKSLAFFGHFLSSATQEVLQTINFSTRW